MAISGTDATFALLPQESRPSFSNKTRPDYNIIIIIECFVRYHLGTTRFITASSCVKGHVVHTLLKFALIQYVSRNKQYGIHTKKALCVVRYFERSFGWPPTWFTQLIYLIILNDMRCFVILYVTYFYWARGRICLIIHQYTLYAMLIYWYLNIENYSLCLFNTRVSFCGLYAVFYVCFFVRQVEDKLVFW